MNIATGRKIEQHAHFLCCRFSSDQSCHQLGQVLFSEFSSGKYISKSRPSDLIEDMQTLGLIEVSNAQARLVDDALSPGFLIAIEFTVAALCNK